MHNPLVSVIIPAYKSEEFILETLNSVKSQTYPNWEIIVVDDCSEDQTEEIVKNFAQTVNNNVTYIAHNINQGVSVARNNAVKASKAEILAFLDSDDIWLEHHLEDSIKQLELSQADLVHSGFQIFNSKTGKKLFICEPTSEELANFPDSFFTRCYVGSFTVVMRKNVFEKVGGFDPILRSTQDYDLWLRIVAEGYKVVYIPGIQALYRRNAHLSLSHNFTRLLQWHCLVLRKNAHLQMFSPQIKGDTISEYHIAVFRRLWSSDMQKALQFLLWSFWLAPQNSIVKFMDRIIYHKPGRLDVDMMDVFDD